MQSQKAFGMPVQECQESFGAPCVQLYHMIESHLSNRNMVLPYRQDADGEIQEISFLGGLLHGYRRVKQAA